METIADIEMPAGSRYRTHAVFGGYAILEISYVGHPCIEEPETYDHEWQYEFHLGTTQRRCQQCNRFEPIQEPQP